MNLLDWDDRHRTEAAHEKPPSPLIEQIASTLPPGRALDLACGTGRNALWLADRGWNVTAVDGSPAAIEILRDRIARHRIATGHHLTIDALTADLEKHGYTLAPERWDLILMSLYLQRDLFEPVKRAVVRGGVVIAIALLGDSGPFRVAPEELRSYFQGWTILHDREGLSGSHAVAEIAARRP